MQYIAFLHSFSAELVPSIFTSEFAWETLLGFIVVLPTFILATYILRNKVAKLRSLKALTLPSIMRNSLALEKYLVGVQSLVCLLETNFVICERICALLPTDRLKANWFLLLSANNAFFETVNILHTLLCSTKKEELTIRPLLEEIVDREKAIPAPIEKEKIDEFCQKISEDYPFPDFFAYTFLQKNDNRPIGDIVRDIKIKKRQEHGLSDLDEIKKGFEKENFHKIRHQSAAHKNKSLDDPAGAGYLYLKEAYIGKLGAIVKRLRVNSYFWFDNELQNPNYEKTVRDFDLLVKKPKS